MGVTNEQTDGAPVGASSPEGQLEARHAPPPLSGLLTIAEFLNAVSPTTTRAEWRAYLLRYIKARKAQGFTLALGPLVYIPDKPGRRYKGCPLPEAKRVRQLLTSALRHLHFDRDHLQTTELPFTPLIVQLNARFREGQWGLKRLGTDRPARGQAVLRLRKSDGSIERYAASFAPPFRVTRTLEDWVYAVLSQALLSGDLVRLKLCRQCAHYFVAVKDLKRDFCSDPCKMDYFPSTPRAKKWREDKRAQASDRALALHKKGVPYVRIKDSTKLSDRVLKKLGVMPSCE
jgi:hypothetical protein